MINFTLLETLILAGILQALVLVVAFGRKMKSPGSESSYYLLIIFCAIMLLARLLSFKFDSPFVYRFAMFADVSIFLFGPLSYAYLRNQFLAGTQIHRLHFLPALAHFAFFCWTCFISTERLSSLYQEGTLPFLFFLIESFGLVSVATYLVLTVKQFNKNLVGHQKYPATALAAAWVLAVVAWLAGYLDTYFVDLTLKAISYELIWVVIPIWIHLVGYYKLIAAKGGVRSARPRLKRVKKEKQELILRPVNKNRIMAST